MDRRTLFRAGAAAALSGSAFASRAVSGQRPRFPEPATLPFREDRRGLKTTAIRAARLIPERPPPAYRPTPGSWDPTDAEVANPLSIYPRFKPRRSRSYADDLGPEAVVAETDKSD